MNSREQEYDPRLGPRSRFGDGDGSFWDRWLVNTSAGLVDGDGYQSGNGYIVDGRGGTAPTQ